MTISIVSGVPVIHWNPRRNNFPFPFSRLPIGNRVNNFGDLLGPAIVEKLLARRAERESPGRGSPRLLSVGSILSHAVNGDVIWGTGVNGKVAAELHTFSRLDVRAVRGPITARFLSDRGIDVPEVFGDPGLLVPELFPEWIDGANQPRRALGIVPNLHDAAKYANHPGFISPIGPPETVVRQIGSCDAIVASSLHGIILGEAMGIPTVPLASGVEPPLKYEDYFRGTGRADVPLVRDLAGAEQLLKRELPWTKLRAVWDSAPLCEAFPFDLWAVPTVDPTRDH